jgi:hypothetical protein
MNDWYPDPTWRVVAQPEPCRHPVDCNTRRHACKAMTTGQVHRPTGWQPCCPEHYGRKMVDGVIVRQPDASRNLAAIRHRKEAARR